MTWTASVLHFLVDGVCAWAMLGRFREGFLLYNFCAFALQLPLGAMLDRLSPRAPRWFAAAGCGLTLLGAFLHPAVLGLGNALFHVGGGVAVLREDWAARREGALLGVFVAPGALGLYVGGVLAGRGGWLLLSAAAMAVVTVLLWRRPLPAVVWPEAPRGTAPWTALALSCLVVVLRSHGGFAAELPWKTGLLALAAAAAVAGGKTLGGILAPRWGGRAVALGSLVLAAVGFRLGEMPAFGLLALLCFNMTMPLTLYALWRRFPEYPGAAFGALTLGLFVGFLPTYFGLALPLGAAGASLLSVVLLWKLL